MMEMMEIMERLLPAPAIRRWGMAVVVAAGVMAGPAAGQVAEIEMAPVPFGVPFQSHNQKVVQNAHGIFATRDGGEVYRSTNGGSSFSLIYDANIDVKPPTLETDENDNLYVIYPESADRRTRFVRFDAGSYTSPAVSTTTSASYSASKFASFYDRTRTTARAGCSTTPPSGATSWSLTSRATSRRASMSGPAAARRDPPTRTCSSTRAASSITP